MIVFDLFCECGYQFEGWFQDSNDFQKQEMGGALVCPRCEGNGVRKILSPVAIKSATARKINVVSDKTEPEQMAADLLKSIQKHVLDNYEDVGARLAEKSLKIHYGLEESRNIRGTSTEEEEKMLKGEGIDLLKIPLPAKSDKN